MSDEAQMKILRAIVFTGTALYLLFGVVDWAFAKRDIRRSQPIPAQIQINEDVLQEHEKRFGASKIGKRYLQPKEKITPQIVNTPVVAPTEPSDEFEVPVLPTTVGDYPYKPPMQWGKQKTLKELLKSKPTAQQAVMDERDKEFMKVYKQVYVETKTKGVGQ